MGANVIITFKTKPETLAAFTEILGRVKKIYRKLTATFPSASSMTPKTLIYLNWLKIGSLKPLIKSTLKA